MLFRYSSRDIAPFDSRALIALSRIGTFRVEPAYPQEPTDHLLRVVYVPAYSACLRIFLWTLRFPTWNISSPTLFPALRDARSADQLAAGGRTTVAALRHLYAELLRQLSSIVVPRAERKRRTSDWASVTSLRGASGGAELHARRPELTAVTFVSGLADQLSPW